MTNIFLYEDFRKFLRDELKRRALRNPKYSLRAFARDIGISFSRLSEILSSESGVSANTAHTIARKLKMTFIESEYFLNLIVSQCGRRVDERHKAKRFIKEYKARKKFICLRENYQKLISRWYYVPLVELLEIKKIRDISRILGVSEDEVVASALVLEEMGQLARNVKEGGWHKVNTFQKVESTTPATAIRQFHRDILKRAAKAIEEQSIEKRKYLSSYFTVKKENLPEARRELEKINQEFLKKYTTDKGADGLYVFSMQLFGLE